MVSSIRIDQSMMMKVIGFMMMLSISSMFGDSHTVEEKPVSAYAPLPPRLRFFYKECEDALSHDCGRDLAATIYKNGTLSNTCCKKLVIAGKLCHNRFVLISLFRHNQTSPLQVLTKSEKVWEYCLDVSGSKN